MRRASLLVACFATFCSPAIAQTRPNDVPSVQRDVRAVERDGIGEREPINKVVAVSDPLPVQKTRSLVSRSSTKGRIDFNIPWQTGIYQ